MERIFNAAVEAARAGEDIQYPGGPFLKAPAQKQQFLFLRICQSLDFGNYLDALNF